MTKSHEVVATRDAPTNIVGGHFEEECIDLLCKQEHTVTALADAARRRRPHDAMQEARKLLLQSLDFCERQFPEDKVEQVGHRLYEINQCTGEYEKTVQARSFGAFKRLAGMTVPKQDEVRQARETLRDQYVEFYTNFFEDCVDRFDAGSPIREQFLQGVEDFLNELRAKW